MNPSNVAKAQTFQCNNATIPRRTGRVVYCNGLQDSFSCAFGAEPSAMIPWSIPFDVIFFYSTSVGSCRSGVTSGPVVRGAERSLVCGRSNRTGAAPSGPAWDLHMKGRAQMAQRNSDHTRSAPAQGRRAQGSACQKKIRGAGRTRAAACPHRASSNTERAQHSVRASSFTMMAELDGRFAAPTQRLAWPCPSLG